MKSIGAVFILISCLQLGSGWIKNKRDRLQCLDSLIFSLGLMKAELSTNLASIPELCRILASEAKKEAADFFGELGKSFDMLGEENFASLWKKSAVKCLPLLNEDELAEFISLGSVLGRYELAEQVNALNSCMEFMSLRLKELRLRYPADAKLSLGVSTAAALMILIGLV